MTPFVLYSGLLQKKALSDLVPPLIHPALRWTCLDFFPGGVEYFRPVDFFLSC